MTSVVVCGAGVIGVCVSYFLGKRGVQVTLVDKCGVACAASGKAGGFLALDWCDSSPLGELARQSFQLHQQLAEELQGAQVYGYRRLNTLSLAVQQAGQRSLSTRQQQVLPDWIDGPVSRAICIGSEATTAQLHPAQFTRALFAHCQSHFGTQLVRGNVEQLILDPATGTVAGLLVDGTLMPADKVVIALGPWSGRLRIPSTSSSSGPAQHFPVSGLKAHSIVLEPPSQASTSPHALFLSYTTPDGRSSEPEVYPRPGGEVYVCGMTDESSELPADADGVEPSSPEAIAMLTSVASTVSTSLAAARLHIAQACFLPVSADGLPLIGKLPSVSGAYIATGHSCWGILNAPATGASMAELILDGCSRLVDLAAFDPGRFL